MFKDKNSRPMFVTVFSKAMLTFGAALCLLAPNSPVRAQESRTIIFDAPGADSNAGDYNGTYPNRINAKEVITGYYVDASNVAHGFLRTPNGKFTTFEAPGAATTPGSYYGTVANSINDLGVITGEYWDANGFGHGFVRTPDGEVTSFDVPGVGGYGTTPVAISPEGAVVGYYTDSNFVFYAFLRKPDGTFQTISGPGACNTSTSTGCYGNEATNMSIRGTIVGNYMDDNFVGHSFIRQPDGAIRTFDAPGAGTLPGSYQGTGCPGCDAGFNLLGAIAATYTDENNVHHGFLRSPDGKFTTFDAPGAGTGAFEGTGCYSDCPVSLNNRGALTGIYIDANFVYHAYLRSPEGKITTIDPQGSFFTFSTGIDDSGAVTGYFLDGNNVYHGFLRMPD